MAANNPNTPTNPVLNRNQSSPVLGSLAQGNLSTASLRNESPTPSNRFRLARLNGFLPPPADEAALSTRGQALPSLLSHIGSPHSPGWRGSISLDEDIEAARGRTSRAGSVWGRSPDGRAREGRDSAEDRRVSMAASVLMTPQMRSQRLIGNSNPRYQWEQYYKTEEELKQYSKPVRKYYERNNNLIQQYAYIDRLLDSSLPHDLIQEYSNHQNHTSNLDIPPTISEVSSPGMMSPNIQPNSSYGSIENALNNGGNGAPKPVKRTPRNLYKLPDDTSTTLHIKTSDDGEETEETPLMPAWSPEEESDSGDRIVTIAIYLNLAANTILLILKIIVTIMTSSVSVLASLVDAALDFLSTAIVWVTTRLISRKDQYMYPVGRRRLEPIGVLVFSVIMITSFVQVALEGLQHLTGTDHAIVQLTIPAVAIMASTVVIKFFCWLYCRFIRNSSVQALAQDAMTDVVFNIFSIIFPLIGYYAEVWWFDPAGGILLSLYVILNWSRTSTTHIRNLTGAAATADERNVLLYLTMRFAKTIRQIQGLQAYHAGDKLNVEVDLVLDENLSLRDTHDLGESLQYVLESVPTVDRAFVHLDYAGWNLPSHMDQHD
ncbi:hypothetical protein K402DRAFT_361196 [Aulographum hederae CBS 113979]|uniref:Cation efflux protein transmembrane domain-containing protein n=1 Tax=Aulographum hederae CBS 113979 TaxID=1176131 RepID=A0A6G1GRS3_9PEZI|nr:hypothetical protein K402DRAFT_361196 [Aulographum hederae CBS 113979]